MNADELRSTQAPLKERYRESPDAALITLRAQGRIGEGVSCKIETGKALVVAGLHPATGGSGLSACSGDMLLEALVACAGVTLNAVATALGIPLRDASLQAEGDLDFRGTLGLVEGGAGRLPGDPAQHHARHRCLRGAARDAPQAHRALLRRLPDAVASARGDSLAKDRRPLAESDPHMSTHAVTVRWARGDHAFTDNRYSRAHVWHFDGGAKVPGSSSPHVVPLPYSDPQAVDPEEAFVASVVELPHALFPVDRRGARILRRQLRR